MNIKTKMLYKSVLLLAPLLAICFGCSCLRITQRQAYNQAEIVAHVTVFNKSEEANQVYYEIHYEEVFKPRPPRNPHVIMPIPLPNEIVTASSSAACGIELEVDQEYLVAGTRQELKLLINSCSPLAGLKWPSVGKKLLKNLRNGFGSVKH